MARWVPRRHRASAWTALRLLSVGTLALVWMVATSILRAPAAFAARLPALADVVAFTPAGLLAAPLVALREHGLGAGLLAVSPVLLGAAACRRRGGDRGAAGGHARLGRGGRALGRAQPDRADGRPADAGAAGVAHVGA